MAKVVYFDMDGTLANLYNVDNWLVKLRAEDVSPYVEAMPMVDMEELTSICKALQEKGYAIGVISWLSRYSSKAYKKAVTNAKKDWLKKYLPIKFDELHFVQYGAPKHIIAKLKKGVLVDDNDEVCQKWEKYGGLTIDAKVDIISKLKSLL